MPTIAARHELEKLLADDVPFGDLTTEALGIGDRAGRMDFTARGPMRLAAVEDAAAMLEIAGAAVTLEASSGSALAAGDAILTATGRADALLRGWKVAQTLIEIWSGVATEAAAIVAAANGMPVACTRKNVPGTKGFAIAAIKAGGALAHRLGLSETVLVFPEHRRFLGAEPLAGTVRCLRAGAPERKLTVEVTTVADGIAAAEAGFDAIQAEKFPPETVADLAAALRGCRPRPLLLAAGGIGARNVGAYVAAGADVIVTSKPYTAPPADVQVAIRPA